MRWRLLGLVFAFSISNIGSELLPFDCAACMRKARVVVIAGIGDSGTRSVRQLANDVVGVRMCPKVRHPSFDDLCAFSQGLFGATKTLLNITRSAFAEPSQLGSEVWKQGMKVACDGAELHDHAGEAGAEITARVMRSANAAP